MTRCFDAYFHMDAFGKQIDFITLCSWEAITVVRFQVPELNNCRETFLLHFT